MNRNRARLIQLAIILFIAAALFLLKNQLPQLIIQKPNQPFSAVKKEEVRELLLTKDKTTKLYKKDKLWYVKKVGQEFRADGEKINKIIDSFVNLSKGEIISNNKNKHKELGIDRQKIEIKTNDKSYVFYIGNSTGISKNYIRIGDENEVFTAEGFDEAFTSDDYRDLLVHLINNETKVTSIEINFDDKKTFLQKIKDKWFVKTVESQYNIETKPRTDSQSESGTGAKKDRVDFFINDLNTLKATDILPKNTNLPEIEPETIKIKEGNQEKSIGFYIRDENNYFAKTSTSEFIFQIPAAYVASLKKEEKDFLE